MPALISRPRTAPCDAGCTGVHSYTSTDVRWCWQGAEPGRHAIDAEVVGGAFPEHVRRFLPQADPWRAWTGLEVEAKLTGVPALVLLRRRAAGAPADATITTSYTTSGDTLICTGVRHG